MTTRRTFIKQTAAAGMLSAIPDFMIPQQGLPEKLIWAYLIHLSYNMWEDSIPLKYRDENYNCT
ncbi:MAG TPA: twin-arginine translocation signal domain-containing protein, partial [Bacteroidales bacterium]|nr:twin-arginine translocation signal domain-containing protein [Bacteroidales bacterium]